MSTKNGPQHQNTGRGHPGVGLLASNLFSVKEYVAIVTGGGTGIGLMIAQTLCANGAKVYITGRRQEALDTVVKHYSGKCGNKDICGEIVGLMCDITKREELQKLCEEIAKREPQGVHILVNNAGVALEEGYTKLEGKEEVDFSNAESLSKWLLRGDQTTWAQTFDTNVTAQFFVAAMFLPQLEKARKNTPGYSPVVINIASISGVMKGSSKGQFAYATSKAALLHLTQMLGTILTKAKIRVNCIAPGLFPSEMTTGESDETNKSIIEKSLNCPAGRPGTEEDMAAAVLYLTGIGGVYVNGQTLYPDGGMVLSNPATI